MSVQRVEPYRNTLPAACSVTSSHAVDGGPRGVHCRQDEVNRFRLHGVAQVCIDLDLSDESRQK
jgi:hypothetical protein